MARHGFPACVGGQTWHCWFLLAVAFCCLSLVGTSGELGGIRQIKIEPDELDIIQITVPGKQWGTGCVQWPLCEQGCCIVSRHFALRRDVCRVSPSMGGPPVPVHWSFFPESHFKGHIGNELVAWGQWRVSLLFLPLLYFFSVSPFPWSKRARFAAFLHVWA